MLRRANQRLDRRLDAGFERPVVAVPMFAVVIVGFGAPLDTLPPTFYVTVAQVLPVLLVVAVVQGGYFSDHPSSRAVRTLLPARNARAHHRW